MSTQSLKLHMHPLSSFCMKVLVALYEAGIPFEAYLVDLGEPAAREAFRKLWPIGQFPVLEDRARGVTVPESSIIIEYLAQHYPAAARLFPPAPAAQLEARLRDRFYDLHVHQQMQKIMTDLIRPAGQNDALGVQQARERLQAAYGIIEAQMASQPWAAGSDFSIADCAAAPALFYAHKVQPLDAYPHTSAFLRRLQQRASFARALQEAEPYFRFIPSERHKYHEVS